VVAEPRVLVQAHDGEECVEHLVRDLRPPLAPPGVGHGGVERPRHEEEDEGHARRDEGEPDEHRRVGGVLRPGDALGAQGAPVHGAEEAGTGGERCHWRVGGRVRAEGGDVELLGRSCPEEVEEPLMLLLALALQHSAAMAFALLVCSLVRLHGD